MKKLASLIALVTFAVPASAHPGTAQEHEYLGVIAHLVVTALPIVVAVALIGLLVHVYRRKA